MLKSIEIDAFQRIPYLKVSLDDAGVHVFCGPNEAGKSSLGEAIRFAIRGLSPRVAKKGAYHELICSGKRSGSVAIDLDGFPVVRNIKDGKVTTKATLDYPDLLVDIQLGAEEFARSDLKALRAMLNHLFQVGAQDEFIRARLKARGVTEDMMNRTLPLIRASGFEAAAKAAADEQARARGEWEGITHEKYGHVKAAKWQPEILGELVPDNLQPIIAGKKAAVKDLGTKRDVLNQRLGGISESLKAHADAGDEPIEKLREALKAAEAEYADNEAAMRTAQQEYQSTVTELQDQIGTLGSDLQVARQAAATLECPCCGAALSIKTTGDVPLLVQAEKAQKPDADLRSIATALDNARQALATTQHDQRAIVEALNVSLSKSMAAVAIAKAALDKRRAAAARPAANPADMEKLADEIAAIDQQIAEAQSELQDLEERSRARDRAKVDKERATEAARLVEQWAILAEALGSGPNGIPAELVAATTRPINVALAKLALPWDTAPCVMGSDLSLARADGTPYYLLSASAKWKANAMMQLALATASNLKLVVLDGFDVIQPADRFGFIDMLTDYHERYPDITVIALGTLKAKPVENIPGVRFYWIQDGQLVQEAA